MDKFIVESWSLSDASSVLLCIRYSSATKVPTFYARMSFNRSVYEQVRAGLNGLQITSPTFTLKRFYQVLASAHQSLGL